MKDHVRFNNTFKASIKLKDIFSKHLKKRKKEKKNNFDRSSNTISPKKFIKCDLDAN